MAAITSETSAPSTAPGPGMSTPSVLALLRAVRRRLWLRQFAASARATAWTTAAVTLSAAAVHAAVRPVAPVAVLAALGLVWAAWLARAAWRRPADRACALWADQHLGGASAFTTLLDTGRDAHGQAPAPAVRWLAAWAAARVPASLHQLAAHREPARLGRPLMSMALCGALASLVMSLPGLSPELPPPVATTPGAAAPDAALRLDDTAAPAALAREIAAALRASPMRDANTPAGGGRRATAAPTQNDDATPPAAAQPGPAPTGTRQAAMAPPAARADAAAAPSAALGQAVGVAGGREAGAGADSRAAQGASRAVRGTMIGRGVALAATGLSGQRRADTDQAASYQADELEAGPAAAGRARPTPAAATPPPATESVRLTPTETSYVRAWMKAGQRRP